MVVLGTVIQFIIAFLEEDLLCSSLSFKSLSFFLSNLLLLTTKKEPLPHCYCTLSSKRREAEKSSEIHFLHGRDGLGWSGN